MILIVCFRELFALKSIPGGSNRIRDDDWCILMLSINEWRYGTCIETKWMDGWRMSLTVDSLVSTDGNTALL